MKIAGRTVVPVAGIVFIIALFLPYFSKATTEYSFWKFGPRAHIVVLLCAMAVIFAALASAASRSSLFPIGGLALSLFILGQYVPEDSYAFDTYSVDSGFFLGVVACLAMIAGMTMLVLSDRRGTARDPGGPISPTPAADTADAH